MHFYGMSRDEFYQLEDDERTELGRYMNEYHRKQSNQG